MADFDLLLLNDIREAGMTHPAILDVGVSSGTTTLDMHDLLARSGVAHEIVATDLWVNARLVTPVNGVDVLLDSGDHPLQFAVGPIVIRPWTRRLDYLTGRWLLTKLARALLAKSNIDHSSGRPVQLASRRLEGAASVRLIEDDVTRANPDFMRRFQVIRAANILNRGYFSEEQLRAIAANLLSYADASGALLAVVRTVLDGGNHGTIFGIDTRGTVRALSRIGNGSEVEDIVLSVGRTPDQAEAVASTSPARAASY